MGISPVLAISTLLDRNGLAIGDVDIVELNEAFASQTIYCIEKLGLDYANVNPNGGAIALGHPTGATGARMTATLLAELERQDKEIGIVSMCARYVYSKCVHFIFSSDLCLLWLTPRIISTGLGVASLFLRE